MYKESKNEARKLVTSLSTADMRQMPVNTRTGKDFGFLIIATAWMKEGNPIDILFSEAGELITDHEKLNALSVFFDKTFVPASLDGVDCLINLDNE